MYEKSSSANNRICKQRMISDVMLGESINDIFILTSARQGQSRNGPYWRLEFRDASGTIQGKIWSPLSLEFPELPTGLAVHVCGRVTSYQDKAEFSIESLRYLDDEENAALELALFMPASPYDPDVMLAELLRLAEVNLTHTPWRELVTRLLTDPVIAGLMRRAPAAKAMHHAYAGGLLEHSLSVARLCLALADLYPQLDRQVLFVGAVCHDLGKIWELSGGLSIDYTSSGRLIGHISQAMEKLAPFIEQSRLEAPLVEHLQHLILSHHGSHEFGSPRLPSTAEAFALHYADNLDAKLQQVSTALKDVDENEWSAYNPGLERFLFRAQLTAEPDAVHASMPLGEAVFPEFFDYPDTLSLPVEPCIDESDYESATAESMIATEEPPTSERMEELATNDGEIIEHTGELDSTSPEGVPSSKRKIGQRPSLLQQPLSLFGQCSSLSKE